MPNEEKKSGEDKEPATTQPATTQPAAEQPAAEQPAAEQPAAEQPALEQLAVAAQKPQKMLLETYEGYQIYGIPPDGPCEVFKGGVQIGASHPKMQAARSAIDFLVKKTTPTSGTGAPATRGRRPGRP